MKFCFCGLIEIVSTLANIISGCPFDRVYLNILVLSLLQLKLSKLMYIMHNTKENTYGITHIR